MGKYQRGSGAVDQEVVVLDRRPAVACERNPTDACFHGEIIGFGARYWYRMDGGTSWWTVPSTDRTRAAASNRQWLPRVHRWWVRYGEPRPPSRWRAHAQGRSRQAPAVGQACFRPVPALKPCYPAGGDSPR